MTFVWLAVALAFGVGEVLSLAFYALFVVVGALAAAIAAAFGATLEVQVVVFALLSLAGMLGARPPLMRYLRSRQGPEVRSGADAMIGLTVPVVEDIRDGHHPGHVRVGGENWPALPETGEPISAGSTVRVTGLRQATLVVSLVSGPPPQSPPADGPAAKEG